MFVKKITGGIAALLLTVAATSAIAETPAAQDVEYHAYWRLGFNMDDSFEENSDEQGQHKIFYDIPTSRHANQPNYFWVQAIKNFDSGLKAAIKIDSEATELPHETGNWDNTLRIRDLYLLAPISEESSIWAGSRVFEFENIRLFDVLSKFDIGGHGVGGNFGPLMVALSYHKEKIQRLDTNGVGINEIDANNVKGKAIQDTRKNKTLLVRYDMGLGTGWAVKPMLKATTYGKLEKTEKDHDNNPTTATVEAKKVKGNTGYTVGATLTRWGDTFWGNTSFWVESVPVDTTGENSGQDQNIGIGESCSYDLGAFGMLCALWIQNESYKDKVQVYKVEDGGLVADGDKTTKSTSKISIGFQPVYYISDKLHVALDLNHAFKTKKTSPTDFNSTLITPILRYSMEKNPMGVPQIYTSVTYGMYDWKARKQANGKYADKLVTTQTGFEIWF